MHQNNNVVGNLTKKILKQKTFLFLLFLVLIVFAVLLTTILEKLYPFVGFILFACALLATNISDALYTFYYRQLSQLPPDQFSKEIQWIPLVIGLSMLTVFIIGILLNIPLHYKTQAGQVVVLIGLIFIFKEFWLAFLSVGTYKKMLRGEVPSSSNSYITLIFELVITAIFYLFSLYKIAIKELMAI